MPKEKQNLMFNAKTGVLIGALPESTPIANLNLTKFKFKEVEVDPINEFWDGDYDTGKVKSVDEKPRFSEQGVKVQSGEAIVNAYPVYKQMNIIMDMLNKSDVANTPEFTAMMDYIGEQREATKLKIKQYKESDAFDYVSEDDIIEFAKKAIDL